MILAGGPSVPVASPAPWGRAVLFVGATLLGTGGCAPEPRDDAPLTHVDGRVEVVSLSWDCDASAGRWNLEAETAFWTGGGELWLTVDGRYVERHELRSAGAAPDGSADLLALNLQILADWRFVSPGVSTAFTCGDDPSGRLRVRDRTGAPADCVEVGPERPVWAEAEGAPDCPISEG